MTDPRGEAGGEPSMVVSPCINICKMDGGVCAGCLRTIDEIARWSNAGEADKRLILAAVALRRQQRELAAP